MERDHSSFNLLLSREDGQHGLSKHYCPSCLQLIGDDDAISRHYLENPVCLKYLQEPAPREGKQTRLDTVWTLSQSDSFIDLILPLAKTSGWYLPGHGRSKGLKPLGGFSGSYAAQDSAYQERNLLRSESVHEGDPGAIQEAEAHLGLESGWPEHSFGGLLGLYPTCGTPRVSVCDNVAEHPGGMELWRYGVHSCVQKQCPICREAWGASEAQRSLIRFAHYASFPNGSKIRRIFSEAKAESEGRVGRAFHRLVCSKLEDSIRSSWRGSPLHLMVSPPQDSSYLKADYPSLRRRAEKIASLAGLAGGNIVFHPYRLHCRLCDSVIPDYQESCPTCGHKSYAWMNGPHFHLVGYGFIKNGADVYSKTGWVAKNLGYRNSVFWTLQYLLSHAGVFVDPDAGVHPKRFQVVSWFGRLGYRAKEMKGVPVLESPRATCPYCQHYLRNPTVSELGRHPPPLDWKEHLEEDYLFAPA